jgi:hypothetical protein
MNIEFALTKRFYYIYLNEHGLKDKLLIWANISAPKN